MNALRTLLEDHHHVLVEIPLDADFGEDLLVRIVRGREVTGRLIAVQVKSGAKYRRKNGYSIPVQDHFHDWRNHDIPVVGVVFDTQSSQLFWINLTQALNRLETAPSSVRVSRDNELHAESMARFVSEIDHYVETRGEPPAATPPPPAKALSHVSQKRKRCPFKPLWHFRQAREGASQPVWADGYLTVRDGAQLWVLEPEPDAQGNLRQHRLTTLYQGQPTSGDGAVFVSGVGGELQSRSLPNLTRGWDKSFKVDDGLATFIAGTVYAAGRPTGLHAINAATGKVRWPPPEPLAHCKVIAAPRLVGHEVVILAELTLDPDTGSERQAGRVVAVNLQNGSARLLYACEDSLLPLWATNETTVFVLERNGSSAHRLTAVDVAAGEALSHCDLSQAVDFAPVASAEMVHVLDRAGQLCSIEAKTGQQRWGFPTGLQLPVGPTTSGDLVLTATGSRQLVALDAKSGEEVMRTKRAPGVITTTPMVVEGTVIAAHRSAEVLAWDLATGAKIGMYPLSVDTRAPGVPIVVDGVLYITDCRGEIHGLVVDPTHSSRKV
ncbi:outer membrane protein assembly factor BamB family protein [Streptomyces liangshanensis]|uniref:outer membrane protein assembly factor BamB family protein n=1 Tax=Streptomyces liangshanensis TaxID=2717324 RepID=UPI0036DE0B6C